MVYEEHNIRCAFADNVYVNRCVSVHNLLFAVPLTLVRASDQNIIDRQGLLMQILLVAGFNIVLFTSMRTQLQIFMCSHGLIDTRPQNRLVCIRVIALVSTIS